jgi:broad specificity phosphatase PhoE
MRFYLIRHADPDYPNNTITPAGHLEAKALGERLSRERLTRIYSSPLGRAVDTMRYTAEATGLQPTIEDWSAELSDCRLDLPPWGDMTMWDIPGQIIRANRPFPTHDNWQEMPCYSKPLFKEPIDRLAQNADAFFARHGYQRQAGVYKIIHPNRERLALFCHGGLGLCLLSHLLEIPLPLMFAGFFLPPSSVTTILFDERSKDIAVPRCIGLGDTSHLYAANLPTQPSGIKANFD